MNPATLQSALSEALTQLTEAQKILGYTDNSLQTFTKHCQDLISQRSGSLDKLENERGNHTAFVVNIQNALRQPEHDAQFAGESNLVAWAKNLRQQVVVLQSQKMASDAGKQASNDDLAGAKSKKAK